MVRAVLDSNVIVSAFTGNPARSAPAEILTRWLLDEFELLVSEYILGEVERTLGNAWFRRFVREEDRNILLRLLEDEAFMTALWRVVVGVAPHAKDDPVISTALSGGADFLVTGDRRLRAVGTHGGVQFLSPSEFRAALAAANPS
ncbi:MAG: putative toxin-antitoxin system toxin component, PIN family [Chloroflexia bacterium]|nr:putative toxin-antitoxin system toxin component, PIN family [Chloroflexia bacterium]